MEQHYKIVAILQIVMGVLSISVGILLLAIAAGVGAIVSVASNNHLALFITTTVAVILGGLLLVISIPSIAAGVGLMHRHEWARILTIILSCFHLLHIPVGTVVGAYSLWALLQPDAKTYLV